jgi:formate/nitrite transporter FocA (FNT family)
VTLGIGCVIFVGTAVWVTTLPAHLTI